MGTFRNFRELFSSSFDVFNSAKWHVQRGNEKGVCRLEIMQMTSLSCSSNKFAQYVKWSTMFFIPYNISKLLPSKICLVGTIFVPKLCLKIKLKCILIFAQDRSCTQLPLLPLSITMITSELCTRLSSIQLKYFQITCQHG